MTSADTERDTGEGLERDRLDPDPVAQFRAWYEEATRVEMALPSACCLATLDPDGYPEARMVLLKEVDAGGFTFYTNLRSRKARSLEAHPRAALVFHWKSLDRQVRVQGDVEPVADEEADAYFATRPRGSQLGAWASAQSDPVESRAALEARFREAEARFDGREVPRPPFWSGFRLRHRRVEFWQQAPYRMHDRFSYTRGEDGGWEIVRLQP